MTEIIIIVLLIAMSAFFSGSETAFSTVNKIRLKNYAAQGNKRASRALEVADHFDAALTAILIGNNVVNILSASLATVVFTRYLGASAVGVSTAVMTVLVLLFGEITPKAYAKAHAESCALLMNRPILALMWIFRPVNWVFQKIRGLKKSGEQAPSVTEDELKVIIDEIEEQGVLEEQESDLVRSALEFDEIQVAQILIPRVNVVAVERWEDVTRIKELFFTEMYSRLPVYDKSIDNIVGVITSKDFFRMLDQGGQDIGTIMQDVLRISEFKRISEVLRSMQRTKLHLAVVLDQYGGTAGIVTMEDIIEELVGEIYDENDEVESPVTQIGENTYEVSGELSTSDLCEKLSLPENAIESTSVSVGGWAMELFGHMPQPGEQITSGRFELTVLKMTDQKIQSVRLRIAPEPAVREDEEA